MCKSKKSICFIAQFPPPIHGLSKAVETLYNSNLNKEFMFEKIDITSNKNIILNIFKIFKSDANLFYFTISQTKGGNWRDLLIMKLINKSKKKCLIHLHGGYYRTLIDKNCGSFQRKLNYNAISRLDGAIVLSKSLKHIFEGMINDDKIFVVPNCVDNQFLMSEENFQTKLAAVYAKKVFNVLYLSNFIESKGYREVLELAKMIKNNKSMSFKFKFAGKFFQEKERIFFESFIKENQLEDFVEYKGIVFGEEKISLLSECDIFILLTRYPNEGQPISILEAMGNGMLVVTTDHAGIPDVVKHEKNGFVVSENCNLYEIYKYLEKTCEEKDTLIKMMKTNYWKVKLQFNEKVYLSNLMEIYRNYTELL